MATGKNVDVKRIQALKWHKEMVDGKSAKEIAKEHGISHDVVDKRLSWARRAGILTDYEDKLLQELIPAAHKALLEALLDGDAAVALEIYKGSLLLKGKEQKTGKMTQQPVSEDSDDLANYMNKYRQLAQEQENLIEGSVEGEVRLLTDGQHEPVLRSDDGGPVEADH